jgi:DNA end-binding protein Ku
MAPRRKENSAHHRQSEGKREALPAPRGVSSRPAWQGHLRLSLVSCAVGLYRATTTASDISFNLINPETGNRIKMITTDPETGPVERSSLVKGYAVEKDKYVLFTDEELRSVKLETTTTLDIERFVAADTIDRLYWDTPYILLPQDKASVEAYSVIQQAMVRSNMVALGRVTMHTRERLLAIEPRDNGLLATTLRMKDEVVNTAVALEDVTTAKPDKQMIEIAEKIIDQLEGPFDPEEFVDRYEEALRDLVEEKKKGHKITRTREVETSGNVVDLMEALKKSLRSQPSRQAAPAKKTVAKKKAARR